jgi:hypothetical protein
MSWWNSNPVFPKKDTPLWGVIDQIPRFIPHSKYVIYRLNVEYMDAVLDFINSNYLYGYRLYKDYLERKVNFPGSLCLVLMDDAKIIGFINSSQIKLNGIECGYVDLMTVHKSYRNLGLAKVLISAITNLSNLKHYIHKKDKCQLPFPYFYKTRHYSGHVPSILFKYTASTGFELRESENNNWHHVMELYEEWLRKQTEFKPSVNLDTFMSSSCVKTYINGEKKAMFSFSIFEFQMGFLKRCKIAEIFFINGHTFNLDFYISIMRCFQNLGIEYAVVQKNSFFSKCIENDEYIESMDLYLHAYNLNIPPMCNDIQLPVL